MLHAFRCGKPEASWKRKGVLRIVLKDVLKSVVERVESVRTSNFPVTCA
jgi:hypothetical protein